MNRQTVAVAINHRAALDPTTGEMTQVPLTESELQSIRQVLVGAIGYSEMRGDLLNVLSMQFAAQELEPIGDMAIWDHPNFNEWVRWFASALVIIVVVLVLVRPAMKKLLNPAAEEDDKLYGPDGLPIGADGETSLISGDIDNSELFEFGSSIELPNLHKDEDVLKAVRALVANEPELAAQVVKNWMQNG
ncbi:flagellar M-ring protein FliF [Vibrio astriarenae]|nr:flagellar M-ring protein FliF [Vibrio sp. C7]